MVLCSLQPLIAQIKPTTGADRLKTVQQRKLLEHKSMLKDAAFRNIGPSIMSGRVVDLDVNPEDPTEFYVAYASGGLWHTTNNGQSFLPIFDSVDILTIGDIAVNWTNRTIWVGTGEVNSSRSSYAGIGIFKSTNNGKSWEYLGLPESHHIGKIQLHPTDNNTAWVAALGHLYSPNKERGVYKTTDGGKTWKQTLYVDDNTGAIDIDINVSNPNELYAAMWYKTRSAWNFEESGKTSGIFKSTDGGNSWQPISKEGAGFPTGEGVGRIGIVVYPKNPSIVYAVVDNQFRKPDTATKRTDTSYTVTTFKTISKDSFAMLEDKKLEQFLRRNRLPAKYTAANVKELVKNEKVKPTALFEYLNVNDGFVNTGIYGCQVYRSDDAGKTWKKTHDKEIGIFSTYGYYFSKVYVSAYNENKVIIFGVPLQLSTDGGKTFKSIDKGNVHADHHAIWMNPKRDSHIINGNDGGANITYDDGATWFKCNTPAVGQYYSVTTDDAKPYNVYGGLQDNNVWYGPSNHKEDIGWIDNGEYPYKSLVGGDGMQVQVDKRDNITTYAGSQFGNYVRMNRLTRGDRKPIRPSHDLGEMPLRFNWETPIVLSKHNQDVFYYGSNKFHRSLNKGEDLQALSADLTNGKKEGDVPFGTLSALAESPLRFGLIYAGSDDGNVHVSRDGGYTWKKISSKLPPGLWVSHIEPSNHKEGRVYVTFNGYRNDHFLPYAFVSDDFGENWKAIGKDLAFEPINVIKEDVKYDSVLYIGTDGGLYASIDAGNSFMMWNAGLPKSVPIHDIAIQQRENDIILGTHGRSLYISKLDKVHELLKDPAIRLKKQSEVDRMVAVATGDQFRDLYKREGIEVECPPVNVAKKKKG
ncbi:MAG: glycosyl hydrolase [Chitinophagaceae bacterium]|nr:glycosyl hydrolase [Chitinophagaceae bacterium]